MKRLLHYGTTLLILSAGLRAQTPGQEVRPAATIVVRPEITDEILANPGMGWETFNRTRKQADNLPPWIPSTVNYSRWGWKVLEPRPGELATGLLDKALKDSHEAGQKLAFRVMCCSPDKGRLYHPDWLEAVGGRILIADRRGVAPLPIPDFDDPVVLARHLDFIKRLGARYDGHPDLDHVDLGSIGWWGEWHLSGSTTAKLPRDDVRRKVVDAYLAAFRKTPLVMLLNGKEFTTYATERGAGWRADSMGDLGSFSPKWSHMRDGYPLWFRETKVSEVWKTAPIAFEPPNAVAEFFEKGWSARWIFNYALALHGSYFNGKSAKLPGDEAFQKELQRFVRRLGYRLVLLELKHPAEAKAGTTLDISMKWQNVGSAPCYQPYRVACQLTGTRGDRWVIVSNLTVNRWLPGSIELFTEEFFKSPGDLPPGPINEIAASLSLPADLPPDEYAISIGVVGLNTQEPVVRLGISGRTPDGWYPVSKVRIAQ